MEWTFNLIGLVNDGEWGNPRVTTIAIGGNYSLMLLLALTLTSQTMRSMENMDLSTLQSQTHITGGQVYPEKTKGLKDLYLLTERVSLLIPTDPRKSSSVLGPSSRREYCFIGWSLYWTTAHLCVSLTMNHTIAFWR